MNSHNSEINKIDAVLLWVDGNDDSYKKKISPYLNVNNTNDKKTFNTRYEQINEIEYAVKSILKFAPYINTIFIVTDNQTPHFLKNSSDVKFSKVKIINHTEIFNGFEEYLPTFNSRSIESCIHRIPNLAEHFIYLNDDFIIINKTKENDFFTNEGYPILRGKWQQFDNFNFFKKDKKARHKKAQEKAASILGFKKLFRFRHTPHPIRKETLSNFYEKNPNVLKNNIQYKFRNKEQFLPVSLAYHLELKNGSCKVENNLNLVYFRSYKKPLLWYKFKLKYLTKKKLFLGLQNLNNASEEKIDFIISWLNNILK